MTNVSHSRFAVVFLLCIIGFYSQKHRLCLSPPCKVQTRTTCVTTHWQTQKVSNSVRQMQRRRRTTTARKRTRRKRTRKKERNKQTKIQQSIYQSQICRKDSKKKERKKKYNKIQKYKIQKYKIQKYNKIHYQSQIFRKASKISFRS